MYAKIAANIFLENPKGKFPLHNMKKMVGKLPLKRKEGHGQ